MKGLLTSLTLFLLMPLPNCHADEEVVLDGRLEWRICPAERPIKGNINFLKNTKIYHLPEGSFYKRTNPEKCFASIEEAERAGFRPSER